MKRTTALALGIGALIIGTGCTPGQLATWQQVTGAQLDTGQHDALIGLPDRPMALPDGRVIGTDGAIAANRPNHCDMYVPTLTAAGWPLEAATWASGVMWRESRCNAAAISRTGDYGLLQLNRIVLADMRQRPALWADTIARLGGVPTPADLLDPTTNAVVALGLYNIGGVRPWT